MPTSNATEAGEAAGVAAQYEAYPYPPRRPEDERRRLITGSPSHLDELTHHCFGGRLPGTRPFRALVAGGGTGDGLIMLAQHLAERGIAAELTYLDLSAAAREVAAARAAVRGLDTIRFVTGSLLEVGRLAPGPYHYIDCCGVLHHLPAPAEGLRALAAQLAPGGGMGLMLYGALGRTGVYPLQQALRALGAGLPPAARIAQARALLADLPDSNWFRKNPFLGDHRRGEDAALYDLLLHSSDRAYGVAELVALLATVGLRLTALLEPLRYDPATWISDPALLARAKALPWLEQAALAENLAGCLKTHVFYAVQAENPVRAPEPDRADLVPVLRDGDGPGLGQALAGMQRKGGRLRLDIEGRKLKLPIPDGAAELTAAIDGRASLGEIFHRLGWDWFTGRPRAERLFALLGPLNLLYWRG